jgi:hypothetical protein
MLLEKFRILYHFYDPFVVIDYQLSLPVLPPPRSKSFLSLCNRSAPAEGRAGIKPSPWGPGHKHGFLSIIIVEGLHYDIKYINTLADFRDL